MGHINFLINFFLPALSYYGAKEIYENKTKQKPQGNNNKKAEKQEKQTNKKTHTKKPPKNIKQ